MVTAAEAAAMVQKEVVATAKAAIGKAGLPASTDVGAESWVKAEADMPTKTSVTDDPSLFITENILKA